MHLRAYLTVSALCAIALGIWFALVRLFFGGF